MRRQLVFMFSGPSFQYYRMGAELYAHHPVFKLHIWIAAMKSPDPS